MLALTEKPAENTTTPGAGMTGPQKSGIINRGRLNKKEATTMTAQELRAKIKEVRKARDYAIEVERDFDKFEILSEKLDELSSQLYKAELREYIAAI